MGRRRSLRRSAPREQSGHHAGSVKRAVPHAALGLFALAIVACAAAPRNAAHTHRFEITNNKPIVQVRVNGCAPLWFILDSGNNGPSIVASESAAKLGLGSKGEEKADIGAGSGADVRIAQGDQPVRLDALGTTLMVPEPRFLTLGHVARAEGRQVDGLLGNDFFERHVVEIDYAKTQITIHDPARYTPRSGAVVLPLSLDMGWAVTQGTVTPRGSKPIPARFLVDTGVRFTLALYQLFSERHGLHELDGNLHDMVIGAGAGGFSRGDVGRVAAISLGSLTFADPVVAFSRDTTGVFAMDGPDGILGGELLRRHRVTFDYPHARMILEPYLAPPKSFEYDMSGLILGTEDPDYTRIRILWVNPRTPADEAKLQVGDEIVSIDGQRTPRLGIDRAREMLRQPVTRQLEIRREGQPLTVRLGARRLV